MRHSLTSLLIATIPLLIFQPQGSFSQARRTDAKPIVTFVELGSVNCIPCRMMQPVMKSVEEKYGNQIKIVFHDVWTPKDGHSPPNSAFA